MMNGSVRVVGVQLILLVDLLFDIGIVLVSNAIYI